MTDVLHRAKDLYVKGYRNRKVSQKIYQKRQKITRCFQTLEDQGACKMHRHMKMRGNVPATGLSLRYLQMFQG